MGKIQFQEGYLEGWAHMTLCTPEPVRERSLCIILHTFYGVLLWACSNGQDEGLPAVLLECNSQCEKKHK